MPTYRALIEFDGSRFHGWQIQPELRTAQGELQRALAVLLRHPVATAGAGRTDRGVHARGQVASFRTDEDLDTARIAAGIEALTERSLGIRRLERAPERFHARHDAIWREYRYRILPRRSPLGGARAAVVAPMPSLPLLRAAAAPLIGSHDFRAFANRSTEETSPICRVVDASWQAWGEEGIELSIRADHFLYKMVRNLVGTLIREVRRSGIDAASRIAAILEGGERGAAGPPAPAHGLRLERVGYDPAWPGAEI